MVLPYSPMLTGQAIQHVATHCKHLRRLHVVTPPAEPEYQRETRDKVPEGVHVTYYDAEGNSIPPPEEESILPPADEVSTA